jgi:hypothetical protein
VALIVRVEVPALDRTWYWDDPKRAELTAEKAESAALDAVVDALGLDASVSSRFER